jgi:hypothetical protein
VQAATPAIIYAGGKSGDRHMDAITPIHRPIDRPLLPIQFLSPLA